MTSKFIDEKDLARWQAQIALAADIISSLTVHLEELNTRSAVTNTLVSICDEMDAELYPEKELDEKVDENNQKQIASIREILEEADGKWISGRELAHRLHTPTPAIDRLVRELKNKDKRTGINYTVVTDPKYCIDKTVTAGE